MTGRENLWMRPDRPARGPRPAFSRARLTEVAIRIADAEGLDAISMRRLATEIGAGTMSLYRYVSSKDDVIELMIDAVVADYLPPDAVMTGDWRADLRGFAVGVRQTMLRHPWVAPLVGTRQQPSPNRVRMLDAALRMVDDLGMSFNEMLTVIGTVFAYVNGFVEAELAEAEALRRTGLDLMEWMTLQVPYLQSVVASGSYPMVARMLTEGGQDYVDVGDRFDFGLDRLLDGIAARLPHASG
ncbi:TetR family transcriptional regulator [Planotetraspora thailandica]|uniref:TetR family transcriptional regulator n=1 Tax=Planotetraspora thailandica TaxID=487172 RepID=A0A8J3UZ15_9ACTN|nr:TetR/AcrR family transcriptional regulator [Planotetraspora thailandica]GII54478.1 TetR family transcriptional regulator [Planotetraspora thailandica]